MENGKNNPDMALPNQDSNMKPMIRVNLISGSVDFRAITIVAVLCRDKKGHQKDALV